jgi:hypothetical protein
MGFAAIFRLHRLFPGMLARSGSEGNPGVQGGEASRCRNAALQTMPGSPH